jgi:septal ring factor EnvC (AmiA/AmiB activator)
MRKEVFVMMKKFLVLIILLAFVATYFGAVGCGPKYASKETLAELEEAEAACEAAKMEVKNLEKKMEQLKEDIAAKEARIVELENQLKELKGM